MQIISSKPNDTEKFAFLLGEQLQSGDVVVLTGDLGAGKTTLTKGIALGLGIQQLIKSPTYTIIREYQSGRLPLYHMDVYRVDQGGAELGLEEYFEGTGVSVVEWGKQLADELPTDYLEIILTRGQESDEQRIITLRALGPTAQARLEQIEAIWKQDRE
ncbi:tRNA (adenosine(37)-N6)-threonylcarbamoyltransferase complex ATPase subunit type 1 TsaE [Enterococcus faecalis]